MADILSLTYKLKVKDDFYKEWEASGKHTAPKNQNIFIGLMHTICKSGYTPFFHLCDRDADLPEHKKVICTEMIMTLIEEVKKEKAPEVFAPKPLNMKHWADVGYVHEETDYTTLHWLAYQNDAEAIKYIINHIDSH